MKSSLLIALILCLVVVLLVGRDLLQRSEPVLRIYPLVGWLRRLLGAMGPKLRQYLVAGDLDERPFTRLEREWVYSSAKGEGSQIAFGGQSDLVARGEAPVIRFRTFPESQALSGVGLLGLESGLLEGEAATEASLKVIGEERGRRNPYRPESYINISGMSFGALSGPAVEALNKAADITNCYQNTGEGGLSDYHRSGGDLVFQIGSGYFGCRDSRGNFDITMLKEVIESAPVRALEIKMSQGAKPGLGGFLPGNKVTPEIARYRGIPIGEDCVSPPRHSQFHDADSLLDWVEYLATETGLPVGIKSAVGDIGFWEDLSRKMDNSDRGVDFITIDGGEGGSGAAPPVFAEAVGYPFHAGFEQVYQQFERRSLENGIVFIGAGKLGLAANAVRAFGLGVDIINVGRTAMLAMGCIQALKCNTGGCPTGIATQRKWLTRGVAPDAAARSISNYISSFRKELLSVAQACGVPHPSLISREHLDYVSLPSTLTDDQTAAFGLLRATTSN